MRLVPHLRVGVVGLLLLWFPMTGRTALANRPDPAAQTAVQQYVQEVVGLGRAPDHHGVWLQSDTGGVLAHHQGTVPLPAASLTKVATTLAALQAWGPTYRFVTLVDATGPLQDGVLQGDLVIQGGGDPFFLTEDALALRKALQELGLKKVAGKLIISGNFFMNFSTNAVQSGKFLKEVLSPMPKRVARKKRQRGTAPPEPSSFTIAGPVEVVSFCPPIRMSLVRHRSLPLFSVLKRMNVHSNNAMANMFTAALGGSSVMVQQAAQAVGLSAEHLHLINGSGLGPENQLSAQTVCALFATIHRLVTPAKLTVADIFPVAGVDRGTIRRRHLPAYAVVKTGTLRQVATLAGVIFTRAHGPVWFALMNQGGNLWGFRAQQDALLQNLIMQWGAVESPPISFAPTSPVPDATRNDILLRTKAGGG
jgi:D-alanyl-D-alanine carboxypeptidase/D-alanyl-D-alanine-endopeptidase (penicillin-binding protein 4)